MNTDIDVNRMLAELNKLTLESLKLEAERRKLDAETPKLDAERRKLERERFLYPAVVGASIVGASVGLTLIVLRGFGWLA